MLHRLQIILEYLCRSLPSERTHREVIIIPVIVPLELFCKILKGIETVCGIEPFIILSVAAFHFTIMPGGKRPDQLVVDPMAFQVHLEQGGLVPMGGKPVDEF